jgi:rubrerythrin
MTLTDLYDRETIGAFQALAEDHRTASPAARKPKFRLPYPPHVPKLEAERRRALSDDCRCDVCGERVPVLRAGEACPECGARQ